MPCDDMCTLGQHEATCPPRRAARVVLYRTAGDRAWAAVAVGSCQLHDHAPLLATCMGVGKGILSRVSARVRGSRPLRCTDATEDAPRRHLNLSTGGGQAQAVSVCHHVKRYSARCVCCVAPAAETPPISVD